MVHDGGFFGIVAVNWSDDDVHPIAIDFVKIGASIDPSETCEVYDLWAGGSHIGNYEGKFLVTGINPHDNVSLKIVCPSVHRNVIDVRASKEL